MMLSVKQLSVNARGICLLNRVNFGLKAGEVLAILGPNGAGKTTLMNALVNIGCRRKNHLGMDWQWFGEVEFAGLSMAQWDAMARAKCMALLPQLSALSFPFTVREVVEMGRLPHDTGMLIDQGIIQQVLSWLDLKHLANRIYTQLSGGEKQRVQLARVMAQIWRKEDAEQRLLILDEPISSLDLGHQQQLMHIVRRFADQGVGVIMVAHDVNLVSHYADQLIALSCGNVVAQGKPGDIINTHLMQQLYQVDTEILHHPQTGKPVVVLGQNGLE
jgi:iron complex transport system ATP-binding protein